MAGSETLGALVEQLCGAGKAEGPVRLPTNARLAAMRHGLHGKGDPREMGPEDCRLQRAGRAMGLPQNQ
jgi:hypothetical protein